MKPFTDTLREYRRGALVDEATAALAEVVKGVMQTGKPGSVTLTLKVSHQKGDRTVMELAGEVNGKPPKEALPVAIFYADDDGALFRADPKQREMDTLFKDTKTAEQASA